MPASLAKRHDEDSFYARAAWEESKTGRRTNPNRALIRIAATDHKATQDQFGGLIALDLHHRETVRIRKLRRNEQKGEPQARLFEAGGLWPLPQTFDMVHESQQQSVFSAWSKAYA